MTEAYGHSYESQYIVLTCCTAAPTRSVPNVALSGVGGGGGGGACKRKPRGGESLGGRPRLPSCPTMKPRGVGAEMAYGWRKKKGFGPPDPMPGPTPALFGGTSKGPALPVQWRWLLLLRVRVPVPVRAGVCARTSPRARTCADGSDGSDTREKRAAVPYSHAYPCHWSRHTPRDGPGTHTAAAAAATPTVTAADGRFHRPSTTERRCNDCDLESRERRDDGTAGDQLIGQGAVLSSLV